MYVSCVTLAKLLTLSLYSQSPLYDIEDIGSIPHRVAVGLRGINMCKELCLAHNMISISINYNFCITMVSSFKLVSNYFLSADFMPATCSNILGMERPCVKTMSSVFVKT